MDHYLDLEILPDPETAPSQLMDALFTKLHIALVAQRDEDIGVSFPGVKTTGLGQRLRLHGSRTSLMALMETSWLLALRDCLQMSPVLPVPSNARFRVVSRIQAKSSPARLRRRQMRRHGMDEAKAHDQIPESAAERLSLPYIHIKSQSTGQSFRLFVQHGPLVDKPVLGTFGKYGLSPTATISWF